MSRLSRSEVMGSLTWSFLEQGGTKLLTLVVQIFLARILAPELFGVLAILLVLVNIADALAQSGLGTALIQYENVKDEDYSTALWLSMFIGLIAYAVLFLAAPLISTLYGIADLTVLLRVLALRIPINSFISIQRSYLQRQLDFQKLFRANFCAALVSGLIGIALAIAGLGVWALIAQVLLQSCLACILMQRLVPWRLRLVFDRSIAKTLFSYGWKISATSVIDAIYNGISELVIGKACSISDLGYYSQGRKWPIAGIGVLSTTVQNVLFPAFSVLKKDSERLHSAIKMALVTGSFLIVPVSIFLIVSAEPAVSLLLTEKWLPCVPIFQATCVGCSILLLQLINLRAYMALGHSGLYLGLEVIKTLFSGIVICATAVYTSNIYYVAIATMVSGLVSVIGIDLWPAKKLLNYGRARQLRDIAPIFAISIISAAASYPIVFLHFSTLATFVAEAIAFFVVYLGLAKLFHIEGLNECTSIAKGLAKKVSAKNQGFPK